MAVPTFRRFSGLCCSSAGDWEALDSWSNSQTLLLLHTWLGNMEATLGLHKLLDTTAAVASKMMTRREIWE